MKDSIAAILAAAIVVACVTALAYFVANPHKHEPAIKVEAVD